MRYMLKTNLFYWLHLFLWLGECGSHYYLCLAASGHYPAEDHCDSKRHPSELWNSTSGSSHEPRHAGTSNRCGSSNNNSVANSKHAEDHDQSTSNVVGGVVIVATTTSAA